MESVIWISPPAPRLLRLQELEDLGLQDVAAGDGEVGGRRAPLRLFHHRSDLEGVGPDRLAATDDAVLMGLVLGRLEDGEVVAADLLVGVDHGREAALALALMKHVRQQQREGFVSDDVARAPDRMAEPERRLLAREARLASLRQAPAQAPRTLPSCHAP